MKKKRKLSIGRIIVWQIKNIFWVNLWILGSWANFISWISPRNVEEKNWKLFLRVWRYFTIKIFLNFLIVPFPTTLERKKATKNETYGELFLFLPKIGSQKIETRKLECDTINIVFKPVTGLNISKFRLLCLFLCRSFMPVVLILLKLEFLYARNLMKNAENWENLLDFHQCLSTGSSTLFQRLSETY